MPTVFRRSFPTFSADARAGAARESASKPAFVLVHGAWHGASTYERVIPLLAARGHAAVARDLPAHGLNARFPVSYLARPLDPSAFATEPSPVAGTTLDDYVASVLTTIDQVRSTGHEQVVLVAHSMGGVVATAVAEQVPDRLAKVVYLTAFMPRSGVPGIAYIQAPENAGELVGPQLLADPTVVGALRIDHRSSSEAYRANSKLAFYADVSQADHDAMAHMLTPDVPLAPFATPIVTTAARWGRVPRYYIRCSEDRAIRPALQQRFIDEADAFVPGNPTVVHELRSSHSPFLSQPEVLVELLVRIASA